MSRHLKGTVTSIDLVAKEQLNQMHHEDEPYHDLLHAAVMLVGSIISLADEDRLPTDLITSIKQQMSELLAQVKDPDWLDEVKTLEAEMEKFLLQSSEQAAG